jgi:hypothetical protein
MNSTRESGSNLHELKCKSCVSDLLAIALASNSSKVSSEWSLLLTCLCVPERLAYVRIASYKVRGHL